MKAFCDLMLGHIRATGIQKKRVFVLVAALGAVLMPTIACSQLTLEPLGRFIHGGLDAGAAEILAYDQQQRCFAVVNGEANAIDVLNIADPTHPKLRSRLSLASADPAGPKFQPTSIAIRDGIWAVAQAALDHRQRGQVTIFRSDGARLGSVAVGYHPDMVTFATGQLLLVANEGEPTADYEFDPLGSISVVDVAALRQFLESNDDSQGSFPDGIVKDLSFEEWDFSSRLDASTRIFGPGSTVSQDLEPEYIACSPDGKWAFATLQENNAIARIDLSVPRIVDIVGLGFQDHSAEDAAIDPSDTDSVAELRQVPVLGMFQPDGIASFEIDGATYFITANEGDEREYGDFAEAARVSELRLSNSLASSASALSRLRVTRTLGDDDDDGVYERLYAFGTRSFSIWDTNAQLVYNSGDLLERMSLDWFPNEFNSNNDGTSFDQRSDDRGPEPEGVVVGRVDGQAYAFLGLERPSAVVAIRLADPLHPEVVAFYHDSPGQRLASTHEATSHASDLSESHDDGRPNRAPEGLCFIPAENSPTGKPLLAVAFEVSGTTQILQITADSNGN